MGCPTVGLSRSRYLAPRCRHSRGDYAKEMKRDSAERNCHAEKRRARHKVSEVASADASQVTSRAVAYVRVRVLLQLARRLGSDIGTEPPRLQEPQSYAAGRRWQPIKQNGGA